MQSTTSHPPHDSLPASAFQRFGSAISFLSIPAVLNLYFLSLRQAPHSSAAQKVSLPSQRTFPPSQPDTVPPCSAFVPTQLYPMHSEAELAAVQVPPHPEGALQLIFFGVSHNPVSLMVQFPLSPVF